MLQRDVKTKETRLDHRWLKRGLPDLASENSERPIQSGFQGKINVLVKTPTMHSLGHTYTKYIFI